MASMPAPEAVGACAGAVTQVPVSQLWPAPVQAVSQQTASLQNSPGAHCETSVQSPPCATGVCVGRGGGGGHCRRGCRRRRRGGGIADAGTTVRGVAGVGAIQLRALGRRRLRAGTRDRRTVGPETRHRAVQPDAGLRQLGAAAGPGRAAGRAGEAGVALARCGKGLVQPCGAETAGAGVPASSSSSPAAGCSRIESCSCKGEQ